MTNPHSHQHSPKHEAEQETEQDAEYKNPSHQHPDDEHDHQHDHSSQDLAKHGYAHGHGDHAGHTHPELTSLAQLNRAFYWGIAINAGFTLIEFLAGYLANSLALIADALHNLNDVASLIISLLGLKLSQKAATYLFSYGFKKSSILASLINIIFLIVVSISIVKAAIERFVTPVESGELAIILVASIGVIINTGSAFLFFKQQKEDINVRGAFVHLLVDALVSVGVVVSGVMILLTGWQWIDPAISLIIGVLILVSSWGLFTSSLRLALDGVPEHVDPEAIKRFICQMPEVDSVHHLHIWALSSRENALTAHLELDESIQTLEEILQVTAKIKTALKTQRIHHATLECCAKKI